MSTEYTDADAFIKEGVLFAGRGDFDNAIMCFTEALALDPNLADACNNRGYAYARKGDYDRAIADFTQALKLDPTNAS
uniref:tetratricopeptide repeat protein n=1 Tax=Treponema endosymbiont of Eucomonympha sp. TaxID=1580831 RepID=UPI000AD5CA5A